MTNLYLALKQIIVSTDDVIRLLLLEVNLVNVVSLLFHFEVLSPDLVVMVVPPDEELFEDVGTCSVCRHHPHQEQFVIFWKLKEIKEPF